MSLRYPQNSPSRPLLNRFGLSLIHKRAYSLLVKFGRWHRQVTQQDMVLNVRGEGEAKVSYSVSLLHQIANVYCCEFEYQPIHSCDCRLKVIQAMQTDMCRDDPTTGSLASDKGFNFKVLTLGTNRSS